MCINLFVNTVDIKSEISHLSSCMSIQMFPPELHPSLPTPTVLPPLPSLLNAIYDHKILLTLRSAWPGPS